MFQFILVVYFALFFSQMLGIIFTYRIPLNIADFCYKLQEDSGSSLFKYLTWMKRQLAKQLRKNVTDVLWYFISLIFILYLYTYIWSPNAANFEENLSGIKQWIVRIQSLLPNVSYQSSSMTGIVLSYCTNWTKWNILCQKSKLNHSAQLLVRTLKISWRLYFMVSLVIFFWKNTRVKKKRYI